MSASTTVRVSVAVWPTVRCAHESHGLSLVTTKNFRTAVRCRFLYHPSACNRYVGHITLNTSAVIRAEILDLLTAAVVTGTYRQRLLVRILEPAWQGRTSGNRQTTEKAGTVLPLQWAPLVWRCNTKFSFKIWCMNMYFAHLQWKVAYITSCQ